MITDPVIPSSSEPMNEHGFITSNNGHVRPLSAGRWLSVQQRSYTDNDETITAWETAYCRLTIPGAPCELLAVIEGDHRAALAAVLANPFVTILNDDGEPATSFTNENEVLEVWFRSHEDIAIWGTLYGEWTDPDDTAALPTDGVAPALKEEAAP